MQPDYILIDHATDGERVAERGTNEIIVKIGLERDDEISKSGSIALTKEGKRN